MKKIKFLIVMFFMLNLVMGAALGSSTVVSAQSANGWTDPVNLSNSGSTTNPWMVVDSKGTIHVFWLDKFEGYKYTSSVDGVQWTEPTAIPVPLPVVKDSAFVPTMLVDNNGIIHIFWMDSRGSLLNRQATSAGIGSPSTWTNTVTLSDSVIKFNAIIDSKGTVHVGYIKSSDQPNAPAGIYYRHLDGAGWSEAQLIYPSKYFRSLSPTDDANVQVAATTVEDAVNVYIGWDDRSQRRIFLTKSIDGGKTWDGAFEVRGPDDFTGLEMPYNINVGAAGDQVLLTWQAGMPGAQCVQYSQWSTDGAKQFSQPLKAQDEFAQCPQSSRFLQSTKDLSVLLLNTYGDLSLIAWDGSRWSNQLTQSDMASFVNPATLDNVIMGCQNIISTNEKIYMVGCDAGQGGDIWFASRPLGSVMAWFPEPSLWSRPEVLTNPAQKITSILSTSDQKNNIHDVWIQNAPEGQAGSMIQYAKWDGQKWSKPSTVISGSDLNPIQATLSLDSLGKLLLAWVDDATGDMYFTWANSDRASSVSEWQAPIYIPSASSANSAPDILTDSSGRMVVAFAVPINEDRGIYIVESEDLGTSWSQPYRVFDASTVNWHMVDRPHIALTGDGRLHILFERYTLWGDERRSNGLYYIQSSDGGVTWSQPEQVSDQPILWSDLISDGKSGLHRIWQEDRGATKVSIHQYSSDGGSTWDAPTTISTLSDKTVANSITMDLFGSLYYLQLTGPDEPSIVDQRWSEAGWKLQAPKTLQIDPAVWNPSSITSSISPDGHLMTSMLGDSASATSTWRSEVLSMSKFLELSMTAPTPYPALIAAPPIAVGTQVASVGQTPTPDSPLANIDNSQPFLSERRNLVGLFLLGGVVTFLVLILLATSRLTGKGKSNAR